MQQGWVHCDVSGLINRIRKKAFTGVISRNEIFRVPDYLPPVLFSPDAERWVVFATSLWANSVTDASSIVMDVRFEDCLAPLASAIVMTLRSDALICEPHLLQQLQAVAEEFPARGVRLSVGSGGGAATLEFRFAVHPRDTRLPLHRDAILLVEDDMLVRMASLDVLESAGYRVIQCASFKEALARYEELERSIRLVIADVTLPDGDGRALASILHSQKKDLPVLLMSGYTQSIPFPEGPGFHFLAKPFNREALLAGVRDCLVGGRACMPATRMSLLSSRQEFVPGAGA